MSSIALRTKEKFASLFAEVKLSHCLITLLSSGLLAFGLYNVHAQSGVTEGGILGLTLWMEHFFRISPAVSGFFLNAICYIVGWRTLGNSFIVYSAVATGGFSIFYGIFEQFPPLFPGIASHPLVAAIVGALFVGVSCGLCVRMGSAPSGDDAFSMTVSKITRIDIQWVYLLSDLSVLALSLSYIPVKRIAYSLLTVLLSGQIIGWMQKIPMKRQKKPSEN